jgi:hypothetical protein
MVCPGTVAGRLQEDLRVELLRFTCRFDFESLRQSVEPNVTRLGYQAVEKRVIFEFGDFL